MFQKRHYEYLADTILNDKVLNVAQKHTVFKFLCRAFLRDFPNFNVAKWVTKWTDRYQSRLDYRVESKSSESNETTEPEPG